MRAPALLCAALVLAASAGCLAAREAPDGDVTEAAASARPPPAPVFDFATLVHPDHPRHDDPALHAAGHGLKQVGHTGIGDVVPPGVPGSISALDVWGGYAVVAGTEGGLGFAIVDVSDPAAPKPVSAFGQNAYGWSARFSDDGRYVFYACQFLPQYFLPSRPPEAPGTGCGAPSAVDPAPALGSAVVAVDVSDKAAPKFVAAHPTRGAHNLYATQIGGVDHVLTDAVEILRFDRAAAAFELVAEVPGVHDVSVARHPVTGDLLAYTGAGGGGFAIYNVTDPARPQPVFAGALEGVQGSHEQTPFPALVDGRALLALGGEDFAGVGPLPNWVSIVDVTDPANPALLSTWAPPFTPRTPWFEYAFSIHDMAATPAGQLAVAWYHAGVWVVDVSTKERQAEPVTLAAFQPHEPVNVTPGHIPVVPVPLVPFVWGAGWDARGHLLVPDMHTGVYVLEPEWGLHPAIDGGQ